MPPAAASPASMKAHCQTCLTKHHPRPSVSTLSRWTAISQGNSPTCRMRFGAPVPSATPCLQSKGSKTTCWRSCCLCAPRLSHSTLDSVTTAPHTLNRRSHHRGWMMCSPGRKTMLDLGLAESTGHQRMCSRHPPRYPSCGALVVYDSNSRRGLAARWDAVWKRMQRTVASPQKASMSHVPLQHRENPLARPEPSLEAALPVTLTQNHWKPLFGRGLWRRCEAHRHRWASTPSWTQRTSWTSSSRSAAAAACRSRSCRQTSLRGPAAPSRRPPWSALCTRRGTPCTRTGRSASPAASAAEAWWKTSSSRRQRSNRRRLRPLACRTRVQLATRSAQAHRLFASPPCRQTPSTATTSSGAARSSSKSHPAASTCRPWTSPTCGGMDAAKLAGLQTEKAKLKPSRA
mmetsp:Transcript_90571/g.251834  ORF Transcript_90571/g.251834 Transcript_90571/m.251834 type:complete len:403 (-) Transcript_90571:251-1459(-)